MRLTCHFVVDLDCVDGKGFFIKTHYIGHCVAGS